MVSGHWQGNTSHFTQHTNSRTSTWRYSLSTTDRKEQAGWVGNCDISISQHSTHSTCSSLYFLSSHIQTSILCSLGSPWILTFGCKIYSAVSYCIFSFWRRSVLNKTKSWLCMGCEKDAKSIATIWWCCLQMSKCPQGYSSEFIFTSVYCIYVVKTLQRAVHPFGATTFQWAPSATYPIATAWDRAKMSRWPNAPFS